VLDDRKHEQAGAAQGDGLEEAARKQRISLRAEKAGPGGGGALGRGVDPGLAEDLPDGGGSGLDAEDEKFAVDVESAWDAVAGFPRLRFPRPLAEPDVRLSPHPALHGIHAAGSVISVGQGDGMLVPLHR
jgi:hypothetical protein